jgi:SAM-dependent MidA family methyltransferase
MNRIVTILRQEVGREGTISFARFMELALYCPDYGYYERAENRIGRSGDFFTSVSVGKVFGQILAFQFESWLSAGSNVEFQLVEGGAHDGQLAYDIMDWMQEHRPKVFASLEYWLVEPSPRHQTWQRDRLDKFADRVHWAEDLERLPTQGITGVIFSNELLDAMPVHQLEWDATVGKWFERGVGLAHDEFVWCRRIDGRDWNLELASAGFEITSGLKAVLPDGFILELSPRSGEWWRKAAMVLRRGRLLTLDYGLTAEQFLGPERRLGTCRSYRRHQRSGSILAQPGDQDITCHINFTYLRKIGEEAGLRTEGLCSQAHFLTHIVGAGRQEFQKELVANPAHVRQFQSLTHPSHLGRSFRVLIQSRGIDS